MNLSVKQAAAQAGVSVALVYAWIAEGLPHYRMGRQGRRGHIRIALADLQAFLASQKQEGRPCMAAPIPRIKVKLKHLQMPS